MNVKSGFNSILLAAAMAAMLIAPAETWAQKRNKPGGGNGGGSANYSLVRLAYPGATRTEALQLNDRANVVGTYRDAANVSHGFHYDFASGDYTSLGALTSAQGINQLDSIVGHSLVTYNNGQEDVLIPGRGLYWSSAADAPRELPPLTGHTHSRAVAINNSKLIVGESYIPEDPPVTPGFRAIVAWYIDADDNLVDPVELPFLTGDIEGRASDLTEAIDVDGINVATVAGTSGEFSGADDWPLPVSWTVTIAENSLTVAGPALFAGSYFLGRTYGVNNFGDAVGMVAIEEGSPASPFQQIAGQPLGSLPLLPKADNGRATSINDSGQIVGSQVAYPRGRGAEFRAIVDQFHHRGGSEQPSKARQWREAGLGHGHQPSNPARRHTRPQSRGHALLADRKVAWAGPWPRELASVYYESRNTNVASNL